MPLPGCCKVSNPTSLTAEAATTTMQKGAAIVERERERTRASVGKKTIAKLQVRERERVRVWECMFAQLAGEFVRCDFYVVANSSEVLPFSIISATATATNLLVIQSIAKWEKLQRCCCSIIKWEWVVCLGVRTGRGLMWMPTPLLPQTNPTLENRKSEKKQRQQEQQQQQQCRSFAYSKCKQVVRCSSRTRAALHTHTHSHPHILMQTYTHTHAWMQFALEEEREEVTLARVIAQSYLQCRS